MEEIHIYYHITDEMVDVLFQFRNDFINNLNKALSLFNYKITIDKWIPDKVDINPMNDYREMYLFFYWQEMPVKDKEELYAAYKSTCVGSLPKKICVFFKEPSDGISASLAEFKASFSIRYGLFSICFDNYDTLKLQFLLQLEDILKRAGHNIMLTSNGKIVIGGNVFVYLDNVPFAFKNKEYCRLQSLVKDIQIKTYETGYLNGQEVIAKKFVQHQKYLLDIARVFARYLSGAESEETRKAYRLFISGNAEDAERVLVCADRHSDDERTRLCERAERLLYKTKELEYTMNQLSYIYFRNGQFMEAESACSDTFTLALLQLINKIHFRYENLVTAIWRVFRRKYDDESDEYLHYLNNQLLDLIALFQKMEGDQELAPDVMRIIERITDACKSNVI